MAGVISLSSQLHDDYYPSWFDFDAALQASRSDYGWAYLDNMELYEDGCNVDGKKNCTVACNRPDLVWGDTYTLHNCVLYPIIAQLMYTNNLTGPSDEYKDGNDNITIATDFGIQADPNSPLFNGWPVIEKCIADYCSQSEHEGCGGDGKGVPVTYYNWHDTWSDDYRTFMTMNFTGTLCTDINAVVNTDIGGIGMFISYIMQIAIVFASWLAWHYLKHWAKYVLFIGEFCRGSDEPWTTAKGRHKELKQGTYKKYLAALLDALKDFQKAQVYFMLAVQIACLIALNNRANLKATSWQQFWNNIGLLFDLGFGGLLPILLVLIILRQAKERETQMLFASTCCVGVATALWVSTWKFLIGPKSAHPDRVQGIESKGPDSCNKIAPTMYCYADDWFYKNMLASKPAITILVFVWIVQFCIIVDHAHIWGKPDEHTRKRYNSFDVTRELLSRQNSEVTGRSRGLLSRQYSSEIAPAKESRWPAWTRSDIVKYVERSIVFGTEVTLLVFIAILFKDYQRLLISNTYKVLDYKDWSLGQVISVTIWVPVLVGFVWKCANYEPHHEKDHRAVRLPSLGNDGDPPGLHVNKRYGGHAPGPSDSTIALTDMKGQVSYPPTPQIESQHLHVQ